MLDLKLRSSDQDNTEPFRLDSTYMEYAIYVLFKIDIMNHIKTKASLAKNFHIQPSEVDMMPMWEYELFMKALNDLVKEENDNQQKEMDKYNINDYKKMSNPSNISKYTHGKMPSMPSIPKF